MASEEKSGEGAPPPDGLDPTTEPSPSTVSRAAWIGGLAVGIGVCAISFTALSMVELPKIAEVVAEMATVAIALLVTTRIWQRSALAGNNAPDEER